MAARKPVAKGAAGTGQRLIHRAGGGAKALKTWRALPKATRRSVKASDYSGGGRGERVMNFVRYIQSKPKPKKTPLDSGRRQMKVR